MMVTLGLYSQYWLLIHVSGFLSPLSALLCMLVCRAMFSVPYIHVNIFQVRNTCSDPLYCTCSVHVLQSTAPLLFHQPLKVTPRLFGLLLHEGPVQSLP